MISSLISILFLFVFGLAVGSFLNVVIYRLPRSESIIWPPSHCPNCNHRLGITDLFPVLSFLWLKGHCRYCHCKIDLRYPLVELLTAMITVICWFRYDWTPFGLMIPVLTYFLIPIAYIDLEHKIIPDLLTLPLIGIGLAFRLWRGDFLTGLIGALAGGSILLIVWLIYPKGMGFGDVKLLTAVGAFLDWQRTGYVLILGSLLGIIVIAPLILLKKMDRKQQFPFGPFLVLATLVIIYW
jgi:leader peptidase (prepilin peptidase) / N-methyltransferase